MELRFSGIIGRVAAVGHVAAIAGTVYVAAVTMPLTRRDHNAERIADLQSMLARYRGMAAEVPRITSSAALSSSAVTGSCASPLGAIARANPREASRARLAGLRGGGEGVRGEEGAGVRAVGQGTSAGA